MEKGQKLQQNNQMSWQIILQMENSMLNEFKRFAHVI